MIVCTVLGNRIIVSILRAELCPIVEKQWVSSCAVILSNIHSIPIVLTCYYEVIILRVEFYAFPNVEAEWKCVRMILTCQLVNLLKAQPVFSRYVAKSMFVILPGSIEV